jgi:hypothetical protein
MQRARGKAGNLEATDVPSFSAILLLHRTGGFSANNPTLTSNWLALVFLQLGRSKQASC